MRLYYAPGACSLAVHIVLRETGLPFALDLVDMRTRTTASGRAFSAVNPKNSVPAVELDSGEILTEVAALLPWIAEQGPEAGLLPPAGTLERFRVAEQLNFIATEVHKGFGPLWLRPSEAVRAQTIEKLNARLESLDRQLARSEHLAGETYTVVDPYAFTILRWASIHKVELTAFPRLQAYLAKVGARRAVREALAAEATG
ncbi:glutathione binding-like protein [Phenylobacterium sp.]|jgi:glutathione S-transferase|uniref:glutathione binding-like protein n=1 Tax=Phenylobacterium sp. TaxID=1871053 RepID=UPI002F958F10